MAILLPRSTGVDSSFTGILFTRRTFFGSSSSSSSPSSASWMSPTNSCDEPSAMLVRRRRISLRFTTECSPPGSHITSTNFSLSSSSMASIIVLASGAGKPSTLTLAISYGFSSVDPALAAVDFRFSPREVLTSAFFFNLK